jgi:hypothetical protein
MSSAIKIIPFEDCGSADLVVDAVYEGEAGGKGISAEALGRLLPGVGNQGGFRASGAGDQKRLVALFSSGEDADWPDYLDHSTGLFTYYGDNKRPGHELHETSRGGNRLLRNSFASLHAVPPDRLRIPPFFIFMKYPTTVSARSFQFKGLAVPGFAGASQTTDLVAVWKTTDGQRFQNYRAVFTVLDVPKVTRAWIRDIDAGNPHTDNAPAAWREWVQSGRYRALISESTTVIRSTEAQIPHTQEGREILEVVWRHFTETPIAFEAFAARIFQMHDSRVMIDEITRGSVDGGRDAVGRYMLGLHNDPVHVEFALEAKCYRPPLNGEAPNTVGVSAVARLVSRLRHRQFGVMVTTSVVARQAYEEVREDRHPIIFFSGGDIANILTSNGYSSPSMVDAWLKREFPIGGSTSSS